MKRVIVFFLLIPLLFLNSCRHKEIYPLMQSESEIASIALVSIVIDENNTLRETELKKISDIKVFMRDFRNVDCYTWFGEPIGITEACDVIKIAYRNEDYELIAWNGTAEYEYGKGLRNYKGFSIFDEESFRNLISMYL